MKTKKILIIVIVLFYLSSYLLLAQNTRDIRDNIGYFWNKTQMKRLVDYLSKNDTDKALNKNFIAGISPHDDYLYAARLYYKLFKRFNTKEVIIFGVTHGSPRKSLNNKDGFLIFDSFKYWKGIYKPITISTLREKIINELPKEDYIINNKASLLEHSIEAMLPFLQYFNHDVKITPIMVTGMKFDKMKIVSSGLSKIILKYIKDNKLTLGKDIFILISSDANHYGKDFNNMVFGEGINAHKKATDFDKETIKAFLTKPLTETKVFGLTKNIWGKTYRNSGKTLWCGKYSIPFGMLTLLNITKSLFPKKNLSGELLLYSDSYSEGVIPLKKTGYGITAPFSYEHWVSYFSAGFYIE